MTKFWGEQSRLMRMPGITAASSTTYILTMFSFPLTLMTSLNWAAHTASISTRTWEARNVFIIFSFTSLLYTKASWPTFICTVFIRTRSGILVSASIRPDATFALVSFVFVILIAAKSKLMDSALFLCYLLLLFLLLCW